MKAVKFAQIAIGQTFVEVEGGKEYVKTGKEMASFKQEDGSEKSFAVDLDEDMLVAE